jgi:Tol biopolymer transport system component
MRRLWVRALSEPEAHPLSSTEDAFRPFWSPDSEALAFFADGKLKRVTLKDGTVQTLAAVGYRPSGGSWSSTNVLVYSDRLSRIFSVSASGGEVTPVTTLDKQREEIAHLAPHFLPDGRHFLFFILAKDPKDSGTYVGALDSSETTRLLDASCSAVIFTSPGYLLYKRGGAVFAQRFDPATLRMTGVPSAVASTNAYGDQFEISAAANGILSFGAAQSSTKLVWFGRDGRALAGVKVPSPLHNPVLSRDGRWLAADGASDDGNTVWIVDLERTTPTRFAAGNIPLWSPDGTHLTFTTRAVSGAVDLSMRSMNPGDTSEQVLVRSHEMKLSGSWSRDGRNLVYTVSDPQSRLDLWVLPAGAGGQPIPFLRTRFNEMHGQISPDGKWLAYASDESGIWEVYVQSFPIPGGKQTISVGGGTEPQWRADGRELFYLAPDGSMMSVETRSGDTFEIKRPHTLFRAPTFLDATTARNRYVVTTDGQRFLIDTVTEQREPLTIIVNWTALLKPGNVEHAN